MYSYGNAEADVCQDGSDVEEQQPKKKEPILKKTKMKEDPEW